MPPIAKTAIVIGAGLSGMAAAAELRAQGLSVTILEASDRVADPWRARHPRLRLNIHRHFAQLPHLRAPRACDTFLPRDAVVDYLGEYADNLKDNIHFNKRVTSVCRDGYIWTVKTNKGDYTCTDLIVATGREKVPDLPLWPGMSGFAGKLIHSAEFGDPSDYDAKTVLVVGAGNSGSDVLNHLSRSNPAQVWISLRHGPAILPTRILGFPMHRLANLFMRVPRWTLDSIMASMQRICFGNLHHFGLRQPKLGGGSRLFNEGVTPALDDGFVASIKSGKFSVVSETIGFSGQSVELADGRKLQPDIVICATGYRAGLEALFGQFDALDAKGYPLHPMGQQDTQNPGLWFTGYGVTFQGFFHAAGISARRIASHIAARESQTRDIHPRQFSQDTTPTKIILSTGSTQ